MKGTDMKRLVIFAVACVVAVLFANATNYTWRGTEENPVWGTTTANWLSGESMVPWVNDSSSSSPKFDSQGATNITVDAAGVEGFEFDAYSGNHTLSGGPVTMKVMDVNNGNITIYNMVSCTDTTSGWGFRMFGGTGSFTIGDGGYLDAYYSPYDNSGSAGTLFVLTNGTFRATFNRNALNNSNKSTIYFNGGTLLHTYGTYSPRVSFGSTKMVLGAGGMHIAERVANGWTFLPGPIGTDADLATDGGLIVDNISNGTYIYMQNHSSNTFRGGLHIAGSGGAVGIDGDSALGAVPAEPTDNIFFECPSNTVSSKFISHGAVTVKANRNIRIGNGVSAQIGSYANNSPLTIKGTISCENPEHGFLLTRHWGGAATVTLDPGNGRTNHISRLSVGIPTVLASGTTLLYSTTGLNQGSDEKYGTNEGSPLHVGSTLEVRNGAELRTAAGSRIITQNGKLLIDGGLVDCDGHEMLHANYAAATTTVRNGGRLYLQNVRIGGNGAGSDASKSVFNIETGGVVRLKGSLYIHGNQQSFKATVNFNGGAIEWAKPEIPGSQFDNCPFGNDNPATETNVVYNVLKGGMNITNDLQMWFYPRIKSGVPAGETDGGLTKWGSHTLAIMRSGHTFNGPLTVMQGTVSIGSNDPLPATLTARVATRFAMNTFRQTFARIEGIGRFTEVVHNGTRLLTVTSAIAPGMGADSLGTLSIQGGAINIADNVALEIDVDEDGGSDCLSYPAEIDLSKMTLKINDLTKLNKEKKYTIATLPGGIKDGKLFESTNLTDNWAVRYHRSSHELRVVNLKGSLIIFR